MIDKFLEWLWKDELEIAGKVYDAMLRGEIQIDECSYYMMNPHKWNK